MLGNVAGIVAKPLHLGALHSHKEAVVLLVVSLPRYTSAWPGSS